MIGSALSESTIRPSDAGTTFLRWALALGLALRLIVLWQTSALGTHIVDEQHYRQIAENLLAGNGFGWGPGALTSIRPPLYPALLAATWSVFGEGNLQAVRVVQIVLALALSAVVYALGTRVYSRPVGRIAAGIVWLYPSFIFFNVLILTETLFTLLLLAFVLSCVTLVQTPRARTALACGLALGLSALTRSVLWPAPLLLCPLMALLIPGPWLRRVALPAALLAGYCLVVGPWAVRNTRLQEVFTVVDTMGGINLRMGNYEFTPDDRMWDTVSIGGDRSWVHGFVTEPPGLAPTEGRKDKWAQREALKYMAANPVETARRSLIKFADFWGLEREFIAGVEVGFFDPPRWFAWTGAMLMVGTFVVLALAGTAGLWLAAPEDWRMQLLLLFPMALIVGGHTLVFGHSRYHLPLMPLLALYATQLAFQFPKVRTSALAVRYGALATVAILLVIWVRQIVLVDAARIGALLQRIG